MGKNMIRSNNWNPENSYIKKSFMCAGDVAPEQNIGLVRAKSWVQSPKLK